VTATTEVVFEKIKWLPGSLVVLEHWEADFNKCFHLFPSAAKNCSYFKHFTKEEEAKGFEAKTQKGEFSLLRYRLPVNEPQCNIFLNTFGQIHHCGDFNQFTN
jgi:hypothetical protein